MRNKVDQNRLCWPIMDRNVACERKADVYISHKQHQGQSVCKSAVLHVVNSTSSAGKPLR